MRTSSRTSARVAGVRATGADVLDVSPGYETITVAVEPDSLRELAAAPGVEAVTEVLAPITSGGGSGGGGPALSAAVNPCAGSVTSEGDAQLRADQARAQYDVDGSGVKVGVLSDSYDRRAGDATDAAGDVATGDLPGVSNPCGRTAGVQVLDDSDGLGTDEGRAMLQVIHDLAPGAGLAFATASGGQTRFADNIRALASVGAKVIVDDFAYLDEPFFQDGPVAVAVNDVTAQGVAYYSATGNNNIISGGNDVSSFEAPSFRPSAACPTGTPPFESSCMDFNPNGADDNTYGITVPAGSSLRLDLQYAQPWNGVTTDLDAYLLNGAAIVALSQNANVATTQKPFEFLSYTNTTGSSQNLSLVIGRYTGPGGGDGANPRLKLIFFQNGFQTVVPNEYATSSGGDVVGPTIFGHNGAANAISTAAVPFNNGATPEAFSSRGPLTLYFGPVSGATAAPALSSPQLLLKPDVAATDGGRTTFFSGSSPPFRFFGTSAAAPHAAAVAALQLSGSPGLSVAQVKADQRSTAVPVGAFGPSAVGSGLLDALGAVAASTPPPDRAPPETAIGAKPKKRTTKKRARFTFSSSEAGSSFECSLNGAAFRACTSPKRVKAKKGKNSFRVRATDPAANTDPTPASDRWKLIKRRR